MAKFLKFFQSDKRKNSRVVAESDAEDDATVIDTSKRKLSISRSGRMKQANRKRLSITKGLYGEEYQSDKPTSKEYHVNKNLVQQSSAPTETKAAGSTPKRLSVEIKAAEQEIDTAFEIIDKT